MRWWPVKMQLAGHASCAVQRLLRAQLKGWELFSICTLCVGAVSIHA